MFVQELKILRWRQRVSSNLTSGTIEIQPARSTKGWAGFSLRFHLMRANHGGKVKHGESVKSRTHML